MKSLGFTHERREKRSPAPATQNKAPAVRGGGGRGVRVGAGCPSQSRLSERRNDAAGLAVRPEAPGQQGGWVASFLASSRRHFRRAGNPEMGGSR